MRGKFVLVCFSILLINNQCALAARMLSYPVDDSTQNIKRGFYYSLPKTIIKGTAKYNLYKVIEYADEDKTEPVRRTYVCLNDEPIALNYSIARDPKARFRVDTKRLRSFTVDTDAAFDLDENNVLIGVNTTMDDRTGEIFESLVATGGNVASALALAASPPAKPIKAIEYKLIGTHTQNFDFDLEEDVAQGTASDLTPGGNVSTISKMITDDSVVQGLMLIAVKDGAMELKFKRMFLPQLSIQVEVPKKLNDCRLSSAAIEQKWNDHWYAKIPFIGDNGKIPGAILRLPKNLKVKCLIEDTSVGMSGPNLDSLSNDPPAAATPETGNAIGGNTEHAVVLRGGINQFNLNWFDSLDKNKRRVVFVENKPFLQYGDVSVIPITSGLFTKRTYALTVSPSGAVTKVGIKSDSRGERMAKSLEKASSHLTPFGELAKAFSKKSGEGK